MTTTTVPSTSPAVHQARLRLDAALSDMEENERKILGTLRARLERLRGEHEAEPDVARKASLLERVFATESELSRAEFHHRQVHERLVSTARVAWARCRANELEQLAGVADQEHDDALARAGHLRGQADSLDQNATAAGRKARRLRVERDELLQAHGISAKTQEMN